ncbi:GNAT family N-acetyltransferase [Henriciella barbarensis]|uniref:GNAT family N-acetyltransferase n=1 Tax=Henriciella barbarensis TaxID=86342 RepID=A0A399QZ14_9PROT|nr:GNAT family N-acetyltransferase [Henriciella barbarensis]
MDVVYIRDDLIAGWRAACEFVAAEKVYLGRVALPPFDPERNLPKRMIAEDLPMYCLVDAGKVVGWADIVPVDIPECAHRGILGIGLLPEARGKGSGKRLLEAVCHHAQRVGIEKVELTVYSSNRAAIALFERYGFRRIGIIQDYRRLDGVTYDGLMMEKSLT